MSLLAEKMTGKKSKAWIGVDFDGTLAKSVPGKHDPEKLGEPVKPMLDRVRKWVKSGKLVKIFTARASDEKSITAIRKWLRKYDLPALEVTNVKDKHMIKCYDDRAVHVKRDTGKIVEAIVDSLLGEARRKQTYHVQPGQTLWFEYHCLESPHSQDANLWYHSHQQVRVLAMEEPGYGKDEEERAVQGQPAAFKVRFKDGLVGTAMEDELFDDPKLFSRPEPPKHSEALLGETENEFMQNAFMRDLVHIAFSNPAAVKIVDGIISGKPFNYANFDAHEELLFHAYKAGEPGKPRYMSYDVGNMRRGGQEFFINPGDRRLAIEILNKVLNREKGMYAAWDQFVDYFECPYGKRCKPRSMTEEIIENLPPFSIGDHVRFLQSLPPHPLVTVTDLRKENGT